MSDGPIRVKFKFKTPFPAYADPVRAQALVQQSARITMQGAVNIMHGAVVENTPFAFGILRKSITGEVFERGNDITGRISTPSPYGAPVEFGSKPHWPPSGPILMWVESFFSGLSYREAKSFAYLVRRKISQKGTKGRFMFRKGFKSEIDRVRRMFKEANAIVLRKLKDR